MHIVHRVASYFIIFLFSLKKLIVCFLLPHVFISSIKFSHISYCYFIILPFLKKILVITKILILFSYNLNYGHIYVSWSNYNLKLIIFKQTNQKKNNISLQKIILIFIHVLKNSVYIFSTLIISNFYLCQKENRNSPSLGLSKLGFSPSFMIWEHFFWCGEN